PSLSHLRRGRGAFAPANLVSSEKETALSSVKEGKMRGRGEWNMVEDYSLISSDSIPSLMEPLHQLHSAIYEVDKRQPLMYPYKVHYQNCPFSEYKSFHRRMIEMIRHGNNHSHQSTFPSSKVACSSDSSEGYDNEKTMIESERTIITENEWAMRVMQWNQMNVSHSLPPTLSSYFSIYLEDVFRRHNTLLRDKAHDKIRWHEGEMGLG
ncbi:hypothetical protein PRIPAC_77982, partial [Pristionchus pacificus]|uniref:Uncharacterized protein n=1 Tax=Pristionchus pacificus TaxID=54126 RepID=A0A2A6CJE4_PRIPA